MSAPPIKGDCVMLAPKTLRDGSEPNVLILKVLCPREGRAYHHLRGTREVLEEVRVIECRLCRDPHELVWAARYFEIVDGVTPLFDEDGTPMVRLRPGGRPC